MSMEISNNYSNYAANYVDTVKKPDSKAAAESKTNTSTNSKDKIQAYYEQLCKKFPQINFNTNDGVLPSNSGRVTVNLSYECLKKMANDPEFAKKIEWNLSGEVAANSMVYGWALRDGVVLGGRTVTYDANGNRQSSCGGMRTANTGNGNSNTDKIQKNKEEEERLLKARKKREEKEKIAEKQAEKKAERVAISEVGQNFYGNNAATTKNVNNTEKFALEKTESTRELSEAEEMELFKKEFYAELERIPKNRTITNLAVNISEEAFKNMKADPEYRAKIMSALQRDLTSSFAPLKASLLITVGATEKDYRGDSWSGPNNDSEFFARSQDSFYKKTSGKKDRNKELLEKYLEKRAQAKRQQQELLDEKAVKAERERSRLAKAWTSERQMAAASNAYDANIMTETAAGGDLLLGINWRNQNRADKKSEISEAAVGQQ